MEKIRIDKWLWTVRLFKSRTLSTTQCKKGNIKLNGISLKPSFVLHSGCTLHVHKNGFNLEIEVLKLIPNRVNATLAQECYNDLTSEEERNKFNNWYIGKGRSELRERGSGRPTKRDRRYLDEFKTLYFDTERSNEG